MSYAPTTTVTTTVSSQQAPALTTFSPSNAPVTVLPPLCPFFPYIFKAAEGNPQLQEVLDLARYHPELLTTLKDTALDVYYDQVDSCEALNKDQKQTVKNVIRVLGGKDNAIQIWTSVLIVTGIVVAFSLAAYFIGKKAGLEKGLRLS